MNVHGPCRGLAVKAMCLSVWVGVTAAALLLGACGEGTQKETFQAKRLVVFGDEASLIKPDGSKYTVNGIDPTTQAVNCSYNPLWVQVVASHYGVVFQECNPSKVPTTSRMQASYGAKAADVAAQVDAVVASGGLSGGDLATVMVGVHDVLAQYETVPRPTEAAMLAAVEQAGTQTGDSVLRLVNLGAKVLISTMPDLSQTPLGRQATPLDSALLHQLSARFNDKLLVRLDDLANGGGRSGALLMLNDQVNFFVTNANNQFGLTNVVDSACVAPAGSITPMLDANLPTACTTANANAAAATWLWAGRVQFSGYGHSQVGQTAVRRLTTNPL
jgi:outer membrane lipase/esterase